MMTDVVQRADVRMIQRCNRLCFALEALPHLRIVGPVRRQHFDRHGALEPRIAGAIDLAHSAGANQLDDLEGAESSAACQCHSFDLRLS
jgi:hypothetical protein